MRESLQKVLVAVALLLLLHTHKVQQIILKQSCKWKIQKNHSLIVYDFLISISISKIAESKLAPLQKLIVLACYTSSVLIQNVKNIEIVISYTSSMIIQNVKKIEIVISYMKALYQNNNLAMMAVSEIIF